MVHISDIQNYIRCHRKFSLAQINKATRFPFLNLCENTNDLILRYFNDDHVFVGSSGDSSECTMNALTSHSSLCDVRFEYMGVRTKIAYMTRYGDAMDLYFMFPTCYPKDGEAFKIKLTCQIITKLKINIHNVYILSLNPKYVRQDNLDVQAMFVKHQQLYRAKNKPSIKISKLLLQPPFPLEKVVEEMGLHNPDKCYRMHKGCYKYDKCAYLDNCFTHYQDMLEVPQITVNNIKNRLDYAQYCSQETKIFLDCSALSTWLMAKIRYPLIYLDFEWDTYAFPPYFNMHPLDVIPFQFSMHIEKTYNETLIHHSYIGEGDCRESFILKLLELIPQHGTILVFNKAGGEKLRLVQLSQQFPQYKKDLESIWERMIDIALPFTSGLIYHQNMQNQFSLKKLIEVFSNKKYSYHNLAIHEGLQAVQVHRALNKLNNADKVNALAQLDEYCTLDTYGVYIILHALIDLLAERGYQHDLFM